MNMRGAGPLLALVVAGHCVCLDVNAQPQPYGSQSQPQPQAGGARSGPPKELMRRMFHSMPANVPVPLPQDAKFVTGYETQYSISKPTTLLRVTSASSQAELLEWYKKNLAAYGWTIGQGVQAGKATMIYASRQNMSCTIEVGAAPAHGKSAATPVMIRYTQR